MLRLSEDGLSITLPPCGAFEILRPLAQHRGADGPAARAADRQPAPLVLTLESLRRRLPEVACNHAGRPLEVTPQERPLGARQFESIVYHEGRLPVRPGNLHDLFNLAMWCRWPQSKAALNALHLERGWQAKSQARTAAGNAATLLDECGVLLAASSDGAETLLRRHAWRSLFLERRASWGRELRAFPVGHGLLEQLCRPYDGLTAKAVCLMTGPFSRNNRAEDSELDQRLAQWISDLSGPRQLLPLPVLGIPGWHAPNQSPAYYENTRYFRPLAEKPENGTNMTIDH